MAVNDIWRVSIIGSHAGADQGIITLHFKMLSGVGTFAGIAGALEAGFVRTVCAQQHTGFRIDMLRGLTVNTTPPVSDEYVANLPVSGSVSGDPLPYQSAMVVTLKTGYAGRSYRGRNYLPGQGEAYFTNGTFASNIVNSIQGAYNTLISTYGAGGSDSNYQLGIWSDKLSVFTPVTQAIVRSNPATQRRRRMAVGT